jgi:hypothetical protein
MVGVFVHFEYDDGFDRERILAVAAAARSTFEAMPQLRLKAFTVDPDRQRATNFYVWESEEAAASFFSAELRERVTGLYGVEPRIELVEIAELVENAASPATA